MQRPIARLFDGIAERYDFLNHLLSFNIDKIWRKKALKGYLEGHLAEVLDVACGTGDFSIRLVKNGAQNVVGIDVSSKMVEIGQAKIAKKRMDGRIALQVGDCAELPFEDGRFDVVTVAFGVRNFERRACSLAEMRRVLKPEGKTVILEFSTPSRFPVKQIYQFYFKCVLPIVGGLVSGDKSAYVYLPNSVYAFPHGDAFLEELSNAGFRELSYRRMTFGIVSVYYAKK